MRIPRFSLCLLVVSLLLGLHPAQATTPEPDSAAPTVAFAIARASLAVGDTQRVSWTVSGGNAGPYKVEHVWWYAMDAEDVELGVVHYALSADASSATHKYLQGAKGDMEIRLRDAKGAVHYARSAEYAITGQAQVTPLEISVTLDKPSVALGQPITATLSISGGLEPYKLTWGSWRTDDNGHAQQDQAAFTGMASVFTPVVGQKGFFSAEVVDAAGQMNGVFASFGITGSSETTPLAVKNLSLSPSTVAIGSPITASWTIEGGTGPYEVTGRWNIRLGYDHQEWFEATINDQSSSSFTPTYGSEGSFELRVKDAKGQINDTGWAFFFITGSPTQDSLSVDLKLSKPSTTIGSPITASWTTTGGAAVQSVTGFWNVDVPGSLAYAQIPADVTDNASSSFAPTEGVKGFLFLNFKTTDGRNKTVKSPEFTILPKPSLLGDADRNGKVDIPDLESVLRYILSDVEPASFSNADVNGDGRIDVKDLAEIIGRIVGG